jgi:hypothetical protein
MRNADTATDGISVQVFDKFGYLTNLTTTLELAIGIYDRNPGGIVTPVFKTFQALQKYRWDISVCDCANDSTHDYFFPLSGIAR